MIIRVTRAEIIEGKVQEFMALIERLWVPWLKAQDGVLGYYSGIDHKSREFLMVSVWESVESLRDVGGDYWERAQINVEALDLMDNIYIRHYVGFGEA